jgi:hypothetical protein
MSCGHDNAKPASRRAHELEVKNNQNAITAYGLRGELSEGVDADRITHYRPSPEIDSQRLISYGIGCMMGRYSLDSPAWSTRALGDIDFNPTGYA